MSPEKQNIAIAEACGWKIERLDHPKLRYEFIHRVTNPKGHNVLYKWATEEECDSESFGACGPTHEHSSYSFPDNLWDVARVLPRYTTDLNAAQEAFKHLSSTQKRDCIAWVVSMLMPGQFLFDATSGQWCEAILRTLRKWEDEE
jgi:hypothetical protein